MHRAVRGYGSDRHHIRCIALLCHLSHFLKTLYPEPLVDRLIVHFVLAVQLNLGLVDFSELKVVHAVVEQV
jgi:hypothetical protein